MEDSARELFEMAEHRIVGVPTYGELLLAAQAAALIEISASLASIARAFENTESTHA
jgi:hypothetical protein